MSSVEENETIQLQTNNFNVKPFLPSTNVYSPHSLAQKLYIIGGKVCVIFAGLEFEIRPFLKELKTRNTLFGELTADQIKDFLNKYDLNTNFGSSAFFMVSVENTGDGSIDVVIFNYPQDIGSKPILTSSVRHKNSFYKRC